MSDDRLYALLDQVIAHPSKNRGSDITPDRRTLQVAIMPLFALANAGMPISGREFTNPVALAVFAGFVVEHPSVSWRSAG